MNLDVTLFSQYENWFVAVKLNAAIYFVVGFMVLQLKKPFIFDSEQIPAARFHAWGKSLLLACLNFAVESVCFSFVYVMVLYFRTTNSPAGLRDGTSWSWLHFFLVLLVFDFETYAIHRLQHWMPFLKKFHSVHHSEIFVDSFTSLRFHPLDAAFYGIVFYGSIYFLNASVLETVCVMNLGHFFIAYNHVDWRENPIFERCLSIIFVTSAFHKVHHSADAPLRNRNFALIFSIWDRVFRTHMRPPKTRITQYGLPEETIADEKFSQLIAPNDLRSVF